jgi:acetyl-CoA carboxylase carboxyltransferase component
MLGDTEAAGASGMPAEHTMSNRVTELRQLKQRARSGPSERATSAQHAKGKLTARERIDSLLDDGSFTEIESLRRHRAVGFGLEANRPYTDGVITGWGTVHGRTVFVYAHDFRMFGGALGEAHAAKIHKIMDMAAKTGAPLVSLNDGAGARIQEGVVALAGYGGIFRRNAQLSGVIPQISVNAWTVRGWRGVLAGTDRLCIHGPRYFDDVHHRPGSRSGRDWRACFARRTWWGRRTC